ncbi:MAG: peptidoglycan editing factor PgeF [Candidatus Marinimicrobia bacterium]|nr:peptidoglycan editing factor PgeF [Candidatus Neomarinimicrobiota bacterium]
MNESIIDYSGYFQFPGLTALFTKNSYPFSPPEDRLELTKIAGFSSDRLVIPKQTHTNHVLVVDEPAFLPDTDGVITNKRNLILSIQVADCIPVFIADKSTQTIGLIHAGWRGVTNGIILETLNKLESLGTIFNNTQVLLGPSIRKCCFEVKEDVLNHFPTEYRNTDDQGRYWIDLQSMVVDQLIGRGILGKKIADVHQCTKCKNDQFHSYRQEGVSAGRMVGLMAIN